MAVTWTAGAPHNDAVKHLAKAGLGGFGTVGGYDSNVTDAVFVPLAWPGNKRAVLTKLTASGTYTTGGDAFDETKLGLAEVHAVFILSDTSANFDPVPANATDAAGVPLVDLTAVQAPKIKMVDKAAEITAADTITGYEFHAIVVGI